MPSTPLTPAANPSPTDELLRLASEIEKDAVALTAKRDRLAVLQQQIDEALDRSPVAGKRRRAKRTRLLDEDNPMSAVGVTLAALQGLTGEFGIQDVAKRLNLSRNAAWGRLDRLERAGRITKTRRGRWILPKEGATQAG